jgi:hypothetical protein
MPSAVPIHMHGVTYPSMTAAAKAFGVNPSTIFRALEDGVIDSYFPDRQCSPKGVAVNGVSYPSIRAASKALRMGRDTIRGRLLDPKNRDVCYAPIPSIPEKNDAN